MLFSRKKDIEIYKNTINELCARIINIQADLDTHKKILGEIALLAMQYPSEGHHIFRLATFEHTGATLESELSAIQKKYNRLGRVQ